MSELLRQLGRLLCAFGIHGRLRVVRRITGTVTELECERCERKMLRTNTVGEPSE